MPTVLRLDGYSISILLPPRGHGPAHVHVKKAGKVAKISLRPLAIIVSSMSRADSRQALLHVQENVEFLLTKWREMHG